MYRYVALYVMTGTGNTLRVANWIAAEARARGAAARVERIEHAAPVEEDPDKRLVALMTATHGFTTPWSMVEFAWRLPPGRGAHAIAIATRAGMRFGPLQPAGVAGTAAYLMAAIMMWRGYRVRGVLHVNMPSNWWSIHPIPKPPFLKPILERSWQLTQRFTVRIFDGRRSWLNTNNLYEALMGLMLAPISVMYALIGHRGLGKLFFVNDKCTGCGACATHCPIDAIEMRGAGDHATPYWLHHCESCMRCSAICPSNAIEASHSWPVLLYFLTAGLVSLGLGAAYATQAPPAWLMNHHGGWSTNLILTLWTVILIGLGGLFHTLNRVPWLNRLFAATTLTHYWGRYREPETKRRALHVKRR